jgi:ferric-dicitrate binding protein FerR (iron transport regulator)
MQTNVECAESEIEPTVCKAAEWYLRCTGDELTVSEHKDFHQWMRASRIHCEEFLNMPQIDAALLLHFAPERASAWEQNEVAALRRALMTLE